MDAHETQGEKVRWKIHKSNTCDFEQILKATAHYTAAIRPLTSHLTSRISNAKMDSYIWTHQCWPSCKDVSSVWSLDAVKEDLSGAMYEDGLMEKKSRNSLLSTWLVDIYIYIFINDNIYIYIYIPAHWTSG